MEIEMTKRETFITCTAAEFKQPIANQVVALLNRDPGNLDRDYIYTMILLSVAMFEAYMVRARYVRLRKQKVLTQAVSVHKTQVIEKKSGLEIFEKLFPRCGKRRLNRLKEVFVVRDVLTHNHLWEWHDDQRGRKVVTRRLFGGDKKFRVTVDDSNLPKLACEIRTRALGLPVVPGEQVRATGKTCFTVLWDALTFASKRRPRLHFGISYVRVPQPILKKQGKPSCNSVEFKELVEWLV